jgi:hypothetical protein
MSISHSRNAGCLLQIGDMNTTTKTPTYASPPFTFLPSLKKTVISGGRAAAATEIKGPTTWENVNFKSNASRCNTPCFEIIEGLIGHSIEDTVCVIQRKSPFATLADIFNINPDETDIYIMKQRTTIPLRAGDIVAYQTDGTPIHNRLCPDERSPLNTKTGFHYLVFLPKIEDIALFDQNVLDNRHVIREMREYIDGWIGCVDAVMADDSRKVTFEWMKGRARDFEAKKFERLSNIDSIYAGGAAEEDKQKKKRKTAA